MRSITRSTSPILCGTLHVLDVTIVVTIPSMRFVLLRVHVTQKKRENSNSNSLLYQTPGVYVQGGGGGSNKQFQQ